MKSKHGAMEMSMGTIVTIVLLVSVLILGLVLVQTIFQSAKGVVDLTDQQLRNEVEKIFAKERKVAIYPGTRLIEIKQGDVDGVGIGIKNLLTGAAGEKKFSYDVVVSDEDVLKKCGMSGDEILGWITTGKTEKDLPISVGDYIDGRILFQVPVGAPLCTVRFRVNVDTEGVTYAGDFFDVTIKAK